MPLLGVVSCRTTRRCCPLYDSRGSMQRSKCPQDQAFALVSLGSKYCIPLESFGFSLASISSTSWQRLQYIHVYIRRQTCKNDKFSSIFTEVSDGTDHPIELQRSKTEEDRIFCFSSGARSLNNVQGVNLRIPLDLALHFCLRFPSNPKALLVSLTCE